MVDTWSYSLMGNDEAIEVYCDLVSLVVSKATEEELLGYKDHIIPKPRYQELINLCYFDLVNYVELKESRMAYIVLGIFLMSYGIPIDVKLKEDILEYSRWEYEKDQIILQEDKVVRKRHLDEFREFLIHCDGNSEIRIPIETVTKIINDMFKSGKISRLKLPNIDYKIRKHSSKCGND